MLIVKIIVFVGAICYAYGLYGHLKIASVTKTEDFDRYVFWGVMVVWLGTLGAVYQIWMDLQQKL